MDSIVFHLNKRFFFLRQVLLGWVARNANQYYFLVKRLLAISLSLSLSLRIFCFNLNFVYYSFSCLHCREAFTPTFSILLSILHIVPILLPLYMLTISFYSVFFFLCLLVKRYIKNSMFVYFI